MVTIFLFFAIWAQAQDYLPRIRHYTQKEGLSHNTIYCMHKDGRGFLWLGTGYGLNRYDGNEFQWFLKENRGLASNFIHQIYEDEEGWLWLVTLQNEYDLVWFEIRSISLLHSQTGEVLSLTEKFGDALPFKVAELRFMKSLPDKSILFITEKGTCFKYLPGREFQVFQFEFDFLRLMDVVPVSATDFWVLVDKEWKPSREILIKTDTTGKVLKQIEKFPQQDNYFLGEDAQNRLWFSMSMRRDVPPPVPSYFLSDEDELVIPDWSEFELPWQSTGHPPKIRTIQLNPFTGFFWAKSNNQVFVFRQDGTVVYDFGESTLSLDERWNMQVLFDEKITWMTDEKSGLSVIELYPNHFKKYLNAPPTSYANVFSCRGIISDNSGRIWTGTYHKGRILDIENGSVLPLHEISHPAMTKDEEGNIWTFGYDGIVRFNQPDYQPQYFERPESIDGDFWAIFEDRKNLVWYANHDELHYLNPETGIHHGIPHQDGFPDFGQTTFYSITQKDERSLWMAGNHGLFIYDYEKGVVAQYNSDRGGDFFIPAKDIHHLYEDSDKVIWLATGDGGLLRWSDPGEPSTVLQFTIANGLSSNRLHAVYEDEFGHLWMSSENGIIQFNKSNFQVKNYFLEDGITDNEFNRISHFQDEKGMIYFGSVNGITAFQPKDFYQNEAAAYDAPLEILSFQQFSSKTDSLEDRTTELIQRNEIQLKPGDQFFNLVVLLLDYGKNESIQYSYLLDGLGKDWISTRDPQINISGLPYGNFILRIKAHNGDGRYSTNELAIPVEVVRPFYLRWWFLGLVAAAGLASIFIFLKWQTKRLRQQKNRLEQLVNERTRTISEQTEQLRQLDQLKSRFFANVSHELRTPLTLMLAPISTLLKGKEDQSRRKQLLQVVQKNGRQLLLLVNEILDLTKLESSQLALSESPVIIHLSLNRLVANFESHARQKNIRLQVENYVDPQLCVNLDEEKFTRIFNNLLSNALKFTPAGGHVSVIMEAPGNLVRLKVEDSGPGIHPDDLPHVFERFYQSKQPDAPTQGGTGIGLALCREYAALFNGNIRVESEWGKGSLFIFEFPKKEATFAMDITEDEAIEIPDISMTAAPAAHISSPHSILLVEDNEELRRYLLSILEEKYTVFARQNGKEALEWLMSEGSYKSKCQLIISDVMMPVMDGFTFLNHVKTDKKLYHIPVAMLTARAGKEDKLKALRIGVDDYILKPFEEEELLVRIENMIRNNDARLQFSKTELIEADTTTPGIEPQTAATLPISQEDKDWLEALETSVLAQISYFDFNTESLAQDMALSRRQLNRRIKKLTGLTAGEYIREVRFQQARHLLESRKYGTVKAVAYSVGVKSLDYFSKQFKQRFGKNPSAY
ncbi:MAG: ATP-binding protein [Bacteroidota bacterium]